MAVRGACMQKAGSRQCAALLHSHSRHHTTPAANCKLFLVTLMLKHSRARLVPQQYFISCRAAQAPLLSACHAIEPGCSTHTSRSWGALQCSQLVISRRHPALQPLTAVASIWGPRPTCSSSPSFGTLPARASRQTAGGGTMALPKIVAFDLDATLWCAESAAASLPPAKSF